MAQGPGRPAASGDVAHVDTQVMTEEASHPGAWASWDPAHVGCLGVLAAGGLGPACASLMPLRASLFWLHHKSFHFSTILSPPSTASH